VVWTATGAERAPTGSIDGGPRLGLTPEPPTGGAWGFTTGGREIVFGSFPCLCEGIAGGWEAWEPLGIGAENADGVESPVTYTPNAMPSARAVTSTRTANRMYPRLTSSGI
jgi:hypothetical protein